ncbi:MAG: choice-of-anchor X domain-containing protein, partial [Acidobacteriota bacterium]
LSRSRFPHATARTASVGGSIEPSKQAIHTIPVEESTPAFLSMLYAGGEADLVLISPSGQRIDPATAAADPDIGFGAGEILGGSIAVYDLAQIEVGTWTAEVTGVSVDDPLVPVGYAVNAWLERPAVRFAGEAEPEAVSAGEPIELFATLLEAGAPLAGASASARVALPDGTASDVTLLDDGSGADVAAGDGVYSGILADTSQPGFYRVAFTAGGTSGEGAAFSREDFALATASVSNSSFTGTFRDFGRDTNGNELFDELVVEVDLDVTAETDYRLFGVLTDSAGNTYEASFEGRLAPGPTAVELAFDGERIFDNRVDGPYTLSVVRLVEEGDLTLLPVDELADAHRTAGYAFEEFEHSPIRLTGNGSAQGIDLDGNGLYDLLDVRLEVEVDETAFYEWSGLLTDLGGTELGFDTGGAFLSAGANELRFVFDGFAIGRNGVDGPYFLSSLLMFGGGSSLVVGTAFETPAFAADQFEGFAVDTTPPEIDVTLEPNVLWPPDHRLVEVTATVNVSDDIDPDPAVELLSIVSSEDDDGLGDGHTTDDVQGAAFGSDDRTFLLRAERSGLGSDRVYTVTYRARDAAGNTATASATVIVPHDRSGKK